MSMMTHLNLLHQARHQTPTLTLTLKSLSQQESKNDGGCPVVSAMLLRCRTLSRQWEVPRHLYSQLQGTFLDDVLGRVDAFAKEIPLQQQPKPGWVAGLQVLSLSDEPSEPARDGEGGCEGGLDGSESESQESEEACPKYSVSKNLANAKPPKKWAA